MNKNLLKIVMVGVIAGFCISAKETQEIAMSRCSKDNGKKNECSSKPSEQKKVAKAKKAKTEEYKPKASVSTDLPVKQKSAARKLIDGE
jgi:hypothetical protein